MPERLLTYSLDVRPHVVEDPRHTEFYAGGHDLKYLVEGSKGETYVQRQFTKGYVNIWVAMKEVGLPVVPEIHIHPLKKIMLLTDLKADGSELYGKGLRQCLGENRVSERHRPRPEIDTRFLELTHPKNFPAIVEAANVVAAHASAHDIGLPDDDAMELLVHPDGSWEMAILDLEYASIQKSVNPGEKVSRAFDNDTYKTNFLFELEDIRRYLLQAA